MGDEEQVDQVVVMPDKPETQTASPAAPKNNVAKAVISSPETSTDAKPQEKSGGPASHKLPRKPLPKKGLFILAILVIVVAVGAILVVDRHSKSTNKTVIIKVAKVSITANALVPANIQVKPGTLVTWTNNDTAQHQIASDPYPNDNSLPSLYSPLLNMRDSYSYTFEHAGTFTYHDQLNPFKLNGTVIVKQ